MRNQWLKAFALGLSRLVRGGCGTRAASPVLQAMMAAIFLVVAPIHAFAAQNATMEASDNGGHARLILTFEKRMPEHRIRVTPGVLIIEVEEAMSINVDDVAGQVENYVGVARADPDGRGIRLSLNQPISVNTMEAGEQLYIDLLPAGWVGLPPALPQEVVDALALRAEEAEKNRLRELREEELRNAPPVEVRVVTTPTFTRFSFGWKDEIAADLTRNGNRVRLQFNRAAPIALDGFKSRLPDYIADLSSKVSIEGLEVFLDVAAATNVRGFREGATYVVDITGEGTAAELAAANDVITTPPAVERLAEAPPAGNVDVSEAALEPEPAEERAEEVAEPDAEAEKEKQKTLYQSARRIAPSVRRIGEMYRIEFPFARKTPAAIFSRGKWLWMVFDSPLPMDTRQIRYDMEAHVSDIQVTRSGKSQAVRLKLKEPMLASSALEDNNWVINVGDFIVKPAAPIKFHRGHSAQGMPSVSINLPDHGDVSTFDDPAIGDSLQVVTILGPSRAVLNQHDYVDFSALATRHGVAIVPKTDGLNIRLGETVVSIEGETGLTLSAVGSFIPSMSSDAPVSVGRLGYVHKEIGKPVNPGEVRQVSQDWMRRIARADKHERALKRVGYAEFLLSEKLAAEGLSILRVASEDDPQLMREPTYRALKGVALVQLHRPIEALKAFDFFGLEESDDIALWTGAALGQLGRWREAQLKLKRGLQALGDYPPADRKKFLYAAARAAIEVNDLGEAQLVFSQLRSESGLEDDAEYLFLKGRLSELLGQKDEAMGLYASLKDSPNRQYASLAQLRSLKLLDAAGAINPADMIRDLERLAIGWRGDDIELNTLRTLSNYYAKTGEFRLAFETMKAASTAAPGNPIVRALQDDMQWVFVDLFLNGNSGGLKPIDELALYYDFKELTPIGRQGDQVIRALADRLIAVDLLTKAEEILEHQIEHRLRGAARAQVAAKLALVQLMDRKPSKALRTLARTRQAVLPETIIKQRVILEARALSETGRLDLAIDLLASVEGPEVERIRADTYWAGNDWQNAGEALEALVGDRYQQNADLPQDMRREVLRAGIAYALAGDRLGLQRLRDNFLFKMRGTPDENAFDVITDDVQRRGTDFRSIAASVARSDTLSDFIRLYREKYEGVGAGS